MSSAFSTRDCAAHLFITLYCSAAFLAGTRASSLFRQASYSLCTSIHASVFRPCLQHNDNHDSCPVSGNVVCAPLLKRRSSLLHRQDKRWSRRRELRRQFGRSGIETRFGERIDSIFGVLFGEKLPRRSEKTRKLRRGTRPTSSRSRAQAYVHHASAIHGPAA